MARNKQKKKSGKSNNNNNETKMTAHHATVRTVVKPKNKRHQHDAKSVIVDSKTKTSTPPSGEQQWTKSKRKRMRQQWSRENKQNQLKLQQYQVNNEKQKLIETNLPLIKSKKSKVTNEATTSSDNNNTKTSKKSLSKLQESFQARLSGSRFRILNQELYTTTSQESFERFSKQPELFEQYHEGFRSQVEHWPVNPVNVIVKWILKKHHKYHSEDDSTFTPLTIADFGCGDAQLAKDLLASSSSSSSTLQIHSFDLVAPCELVTACDMRHTPLPDQSVDIVVFCLALMGTNLCDFIREAYRVLKPNGRVKIAEVRSRLDDDIPKFVQVLNQLGFNVVGKIDRSNKMFIMMELTKNGQTPSQKVSFTAKPCIYKRR